MKILIFNGSPEKGAESTAEVIKQYFNEQLINLGHSVSIFDLPDANIPFLDMNPLNSIPASVQQMCKTFTDADIHIWLSPLYHGGIPGSTKNCLDWLEITSKADKPYLAGKVIGLVCWADGVQAMQGINNMEAVSKALRAWVLPYSLPISRRDLFEPGTKQLSIVYQSRFDIMIQSLHAIEPYHTFLQTQE